MYILYIYILQFYQLTNLNEGNFGKAIQHLGVEDEAWDQAPARQRPSLGEKFGMVDPIALPP